MAQEINNKKGNWFWEVIKFLFNFITNKGIIRYFRELKRDKKIDRNFDTLNQKIDSSNKNKTEEILLRQLLNKKILDKEKLLKDIKGNCYLLIVFAFPNLPKILDNITQTKVSDYLRKKLKEKKLSEKRKYIYFLTEELKFKKLGYKSSTIFFTKLIDLPKKLRSIKKLKSYLEKELILKQQEEWDLILEILNKSKSEVIKKYRSILLKKGFENSYNISFYLNFITFKKENIFTQNENSLLISQLLSLEDILKNNKNLESIKQNLNCFDMSLFFTNSLSNEVKEILDKKQNNIKSNLKISNFFEEINKEDLKSEFKNILKDKYENKIINSFYKKQNDFRNLLVTKGVIN